MAVGVLSGYCVAERVEKQSLEHSEVFRMFKECVLLCSSSLFTVLFLVCATGSRTLILQLYFYVKQIIVRFYFVTRK